METLSESELGFLKASIQAGNKDAIRTLTNYYFGEIWANMMNGTMDEQADALINLEIDLQNNADDFCNSKESPEHYLRRKWKEKLAGLRKRTVAFNSDFMGVKKEGVAEQETTTLPSSISFQYQYFLSSLNPILRMLFETKYFQGLTGKNGLFQVTHFLLNATTIGYPALSKTLKRISGLQEPLIPSFLIKQAKHIFTNQPVDKPETLRTLLQNLPAKRSVLKKAFHSYDMKIFRTHNDFKEKLSTIKSLSTLEQAFVLSNEYLKIEDRIEFWTQINIDSQHHVDLKKELIKFNLYDKRINDKHLGWKRNAIIKNLNPGKKNLIIIENTINSIQNKINDQLQNTIIWQTR